ncbi:MAG: tetratricopeptide repeat protein [Spirochaetia bacterium]|jgi:tetratricopeptide (TPR) repeat protein|nr:tetratricopeptide repeat protein [Spirochaetia bacterium]
MNDYSPVHVRSVDPYLKKLRRRRLIKGSIVVVAALAVIVFSVMALTMLAARKSSPKATQQSIVELWSQKAYQAVYDESSLSLELSPLDPFMLVFQGFSAFYLGLAESDGEQRALKIDESIFSIRKALLDAKAPLKPEATYILGKAYFHKGIDYYNEAIRYLEQSNALGYSQADTWEYLALASQGTGQLELSIRYYEKALLDKPLSTELMLACAGAHVAAGDVDRAESLATQAMSMTDDEFLAERCGFLLGDIYRNSGRMNLALERYEAIKVKNPQSADAWYYQGLVLSTSGDPIGARAAWRKAISVDPMHSGARQKLSER